MRFFSILPFASLAFALPSASPQSSCTKVSIENANFDDLVGTPTILSRIPVPYKSLNWQGFNFATVIKTNTLPGPIPHSGSNYAFSNTATQTTQGTASWSAVDYPDSKNKTFSLESFYYSCILSAANGAAAPPMACNIAITAFKQVGFNTAQAVEVGAQTFTYDPTTSLGPQQQAFGQFSSVFQDISYVMLQYTVADQTKAPAQSDLSIQIDDVRYTVCEYGN